MRYKTVLKMALITFVGIVVIWYWSQPKSHLDHRGDIMQDTNIRSEEDLHKMKKLVSTLSEIEKKGKQDNSDMGSKKTFSENSSEVEYKHDKKVGEF